MIGFAVKAFAIFALVTMLVAATAALCAVWWMMGRIVMRAIEMRSLSRALNEDFRF